MIDLIKKHKGLAILSGLSLILIIIMIAIFLSLYFGGSKNKYGNRLDGIEEVKIDNSFYDTLSASLRENEGVEEAKCRLQGKIIYVELTLNNSVSKDKAKEIARATLEMFEEDKLAFYDLEYFLRWKANEDEENAVDTVIVGTKHPYIDDISWTRS